MPSWPLCTLNTIYHAPHLSVGNGADWWETSEGRLHTRATPGGPAKNTSPTYSPEIQGWDFRWLELLVAGYPPSFSHSSSSSQLKSQACISREYVGLVFLVTGAGVFGVALVSQPSPPCDTMDMWTCHTMRAVHVIFLEVSLAFGK